MCRNHRLGAYALVDTQLTGLGALMADDGIFIIRCFIKGKDHFMAYRANGRLLFVNPKVKVLVGHDVASADDVQVRFVAHGARAAGTGCGVVRRPDLLIPEECPQVATLWGSGDGRRCARARGVV